MKDPFKKRRYKRKCPVCGKPLRKHEWADEQGRCAFVCGEHAFVIRRGAYIRVDE
jgi:hypothetical protein